MSSVVQPATVRTKRIHSKKLNVGKAVSDIEFVSLVCTLLQAGEVVTMTDLKSAYSNMLESNGVHMKPST